MPSTRLVAIEMPTDAPAPPPPPNAPAKASAPAPARMVASSVAVIVIAPPLAVTPLVSSGLALARLLWM